PRGARAKRRPKRRPSPRRNPLHSCATLWPASKAFSGNPLRHLGPSRTRGITAARCKRRDRVQSTGSLPGKPQRCPWWNHAATMPTRIRTQLTLEAERANREQLVRLGAEAREARYRRRLTQRQLGVRVGLSQSAMSRLEQGGGGRMTLDALQRVAVALQITLRVGFQRDPLSETTDAGHLA